MGSQEPSTQGSEVEEEDEEDNTNSEEESELEALRLAALITKKENDPDRQVVVSLQLSVPITVESLTNHRCCCYCSIFQSVTYNVFL